MKWYYWLLVPFILAYEALKWLCSEDGLYVMIALLFGVSDIPGPFDQ